MIRKTIRLWMAAAALMLAGCDMNDPIYNTAHPETGQITFATDFSQRTEGVPVPAQVTAKVGSYSATLATDKPVVFPNLIPPGTYHLNLYNTVERITVSGATATADYGTPAAALGWFFTWAQDVAIEKDKDYDLTAAMRQQVRQLTLVIEPTGGTVDKITSVDATLTGVASELDFDTDTYFAPVSVKPTFTKGADGKYTAVLRLLGIMGPEQKLTVTMTFMDGNPQPVTATHDLTALLATFNTDKKTPLTLGARAMETPTGAGFTATITPWIQVTGSGTAD